MTTATPRGPDWRTPANATPERARNRTIARVLRAVVAVAVVTSAVIWWVQPARPPVLLAVSLPVADGRLVPFADADFGRMTDPNRFGPPPVSLALSPDRDRLRVALAALSRVPAQHPLVLSVSGGVEVDASGALVLSAGASGADHTRNRLPLTELLDHVRSCPSHHRLVVLELTSDQPDWVRGAEAALEAVPDDRRLVLFANGPGERTYLSEQWRGSVFVHYWTIGIQGAADGWNPGSDRNGRVEVSELAAFLRSRVSRWAERNRTTPQTPWLTGRAEDFTLGIAVTLTSEGEIEPPRYPDALKEAWAVRDAWLKDGRADSTPELDQQLVQSLLIMDRDWLSGQPVESVRKAFDTEIIAVTEQATARQAVSIPDSFKLKLAVDAAQIESLRKYLIRTDGQPAPTEKPPVVTADAVMTVAVEEPTPARWKRLAALLAEVEPEPSGIPSLLFRRLAADPVGPTLMRSRLLTSAVELDILTRSSAFFGWGRTAIEDAYVQWMTAAAFVLAPQYASAVTTEDHLKRAEDALQKLRSAHDSFGKATGVRHTADRAILAVPIARLDERFLSSASTLRSALIPPPQPPSPTALELAAGGWRDATRAVESLLPEVVAPYRPEAIRRMVKRADVSDAGPAELTEMERTLQVPLLSAPDRATLWAAKLKLSHRLHDDIARRDRADDDEIVSSRRTPDWIDPRDPPPLRVDPNARTPQRPPVPSVTEEHKSATHEFLNWQIRRFEYETLNPLDLPDAKPEVGFAGRSLAALRKFGVASSSTPHLELDSTPVALTAESPAGASTVSLRLLGATAPDQTTVRVHSPTPEWVTTGEPTAVALSPVRAVTVNQRVGAGRRPEKHQNFRGVLVTADVGGRPFVRRLSVNTDSLSNRLDLLVKSTADAPAVRDADLSVRPNGRPTPFTLLLANPTATAQSVIVRLVNPARETAPIILAPDESKPIVFIAPAVAPALPLAPPPPPPPEFGEAPETFRIELLDAKTRDVRQSFTLPVRVLDPNRLLNFRDVLYRAGGDGKADELAAVVSERETFTGGPVPITLSFPADRNPGLTVADGKLSGTLEPGGKPLRLYATNLKYDISVGGRVVAVVQADGVERAFTFTGEVSAADGTVRFQPMTAPRVRVRADDYTTGTAPLPIRLETDNAPVNATLDVQIGTLSSGMFTSDFTHAPLPAKARTVGVKFDPKGGMVLKAAVSDLESSLPVDELVGVRFIQARLLDANGVELARDVRRVTFDGTPPQKVRFIELPARARKDQPLAVRATSDLPVSGIKEVWFFVGKPVNNVPPSNAALIPGKPGDVPGEWTAALPLGDGLTPVDVSVQFVSHTKLSGFATQTVERADPVELARPLPAKIKGQVTEGPLPQPGLAVTLFDDKGKEKAKAKSKDDGGFEFADLPPGKYRLFAAKSSTGREKSLPVELKAGEEKVITLGLLLK